MHPSVLMMRRESGCCEGVVMDALSEVLVFSVPLSVKPSQL